MSVRRVNPSPSIISPPARQPSGIVTIPMRMPLASAGWSFFSMIPRATGIEKTMVGPIIPPRMIPANRPICGLAAICIASGYPPMSQAKSVVANIEGSAPTA